MVCIESAYWKLSGNSVVVRTLAMIYKDNKANALVCKYNFIKAKSKPIDCKNCKEIIELWKILGVFTYFLYRKAPKLFCISFTYLITANYATPYSPLLFSPL